jgi:hypothetical protein
MKTYLDCLPCLMSQALRAAMSAFKYIQEQENGTGITSP